MVIHIFPRFDTLPFRSIYGMYNNHAVNCTPLSAVYIYTHDRNMCHIVIYVVCHVFVVMHIVYVVAVYCVAYTSVVYRH